MGGPLGEAGSVHALDVFPIVAGITILSGAALYWRDTGGLQPAWITSPPGLASTIGGLAAIVTFVGGMLGLTMAVGRYL